MTDEMSVSFEEIQGMIYQQHYYDAYASEDRKTFDDTNNFELPKGIKSFREKLKLTKLKAFYFNFLLTVIFSSKRTKKKRKGKVESPRFEREFQQVKEDCAIAEQRT